jgi:hypothetical protein
MALTFLYFAVTPQQGGYSRRANRLVNFDMTILDVTRFVTMLFMYSHRFPQARTLLSSALYLARGFVKDRLPFSDLLCTSACRFLVCNTSVWHV